MGLNKNYSDIQNSDIASIFNHHCHVQSDINEHLPFLYKLASTVNHITEFGTRTGVSTSAFILSAPEKIITYDIEKKESISRLEKGATEIGVDFKFHEASDLDIEIEETDLLFIDTWHIYEQMQAELLRHAYKVKKYIVFHDTETFAFLGETQGHIGIWYAISEFLKQHSEWILMQHFKNNNGLTVLMKL